jgi:hypothetical protein
MNAPMPSAPRSLRRLLVAGALLVGIVPSLPTPVAASQVYPVRVVATEPGVQSAVFSTNAKVMLVGSPVRDRQVNLVTGATAPVSIPNATPTDGGRFAFGFQGFDSLEQFVYRQNLSTSVVDEAQVNFPESWGISEIVGSDDLGRYVLLRASSGSFGTAAFLFDFERQQLVGVNADPQLRLSAGANGVPIAISSDGSLVTFAESSAINLDRIVELNRVTGARRVVEVPAEAYQFQFDVSGDLGWVLFRSNLPGVVPGLSGGFRLYVRNVSSGATLAVPIPDDTVETIEVFNGGRVVAKVSGNDSDQVEVWQPGQSQSIRVSVGVDGSPAENGVVDVVANADASLIYFSSFANNVVPRSPADEARLFEVALLPLAPVAVGTPLQPSETRCLTVVGADPGDFVGVNITPVQATARGYGTMHSSDTDAGSTSNVNYDVGTINPGHAIVKVGADGRICYTNGPTASAHVIIDQLTSAPTDLAAPTFTDPTADGATRLMNTRDGLGGSLLGPGETRCVSPLGANPLTNDLVGVNITPVQATGRGYGTIHISTSAAGATSNVNYDVGTVNPNFAMVQVGRDNQICFTNGPTASTHVIIDQLIVARNNASTSPRFVRASISSGSARLINTRDGNGGAILGPSETRCALAGNAQTGAVAANEYVAVNITPVQATGRGYGTVHSSSTAAGTTSNVNYNAGTINPNFAIVQAGADGKICFTNGPTASVHLILDQFIAAPTDPAKPTFANPTANGAVRLVDTRPSV